MQNFDAGDVKLQRQLAPKVKAAILAMALAHNVTPTMDDNGQIQYQVSTFHSKIN
jgi:hypothetical protein